MLCIHVDLSYRCTAALTSSISSIKVQLRYFVLLFITSQSPGANLQTFLKKVLRQNDPRKIWNICEFLSLIIWGTCYAVTSILKAQGFYRHCKRRWHHFAQPGCHCKQWATMYQQLSTSFGAGKSAWRRKRDVSRLQWGEAEQVRDWCKEKCRTRLGRGISAAAAPLLPFPPSSLEPPSWVHSNLRQLNHAADGYIQSYT